LPAPKPATDSQPPSPSEPPTNAPPSATPSASPSSSPAEHPSATAIPKGTIHIAIDTPAGNREDATRVIERLKPVVASCHRRGLAPKPEAAASLQGSFRLAITVAHSGKVSGLRLPYQNPRNPDFDAAAGPYPNPTNPVLSQVVVPCVSAFIEQSRFRAAETDWWVLLDVKVD
jgi:outer membrane biosynthesis protein TonB